MTDRELLILAAKAAGIELFYRSTGEPGFSEVHGLAVAVSNRWWNPLSDDGDALRLAVKLGIDIAQATLNYWDASSTDPYDATRRAIVRTAAEMGAK